MTDLVMTIYSDEEVEQESDGEFGFDEGNTAGYVSDKSVKNKFLKLKGKSKNYQNAQRNSRRKKEDNNSIREGPKIDQKEEKKIGIM
jgi:hypothetical protein